MPTDVGVHPRVSPACSDSEKSEKSAQPGPPGHSTCSDLSFPVLSADARTNPSRGVDLKYAAKATSTP